MENIENKDLAPSPEENKGEFRSLIVGSVRETDPPSDSLLIGFDNSAISLELEKDYLSEHGLSDIAEGDNIEIKGKKGNEDDDLWGIAKIEDIRRAE